MPGFVPHPAPQQVAQNGSGGPTFQKVAGLFWPQGDPARLNHAADAWTRMAQELDAVSGACASIAGSVRANRGSGIDAFSQYWFGPRLHALWVTVNYSVSKLGQLMKL